MNIYRKPGGFVPGAGIAQRGISDHLADLVDPLADVVEVLGRTGRGAAAFAVDEFLPVQDGAAYALGKIGPEAAEAKPALWEGLESEDEMVPMVCAWALAMIDPECEETCPKTVPLLIKALEMPEPLARIEAAAALKCLGPLAEPAKSTLELVAENDEEPLVREVAAEALEAIAGSMAAPEIEKGSTIVTETDDVLAELGKIEMAVAVY